MKLVIGSDHAGFTLKDKVIPWLRSVAGGKHRVVDLGPETPERTDYPDFAALVGRTVARGGAARGILFCGTGIGMAMAANKIHGVRAAVAWNPASAALASEHNHANILCLPARFIGFKKAQTMIHTFLTTPYAGGRHARRVRKIQKMDHC